MLIIRKLTKIGTITKKKQGSLGPLLLFEWVTPDHGYFTIVTSIDGIATIFREVSGANIASNDRSAPITESYGEFIHD